MVKLSIKDLDYVNGGNYYFTLNSDGVIECRVYMDQITRENRGCILPPRLVCDLFNNIYDQMREDLKSDEDSIDRYEVDLAELDYLVEIFNY